MSKMKNEEPMPHRDWCLKPLGHATNVIDEIEIVHTLKQHK